MPNLEELSVVALLEDLPEKGLFRGQVGTVVEILAPEVVLVEFCNSEGVPYAMEAVKIALLMRLLHKPLEQVA